MKKIYTKSDLVNLQITELSVIVEKINSLNSNTIHAFKSKPIKPYQKKMCVSKKKKLNRQKLGKPKPTDFFFEKLITT